VSEIDRVLTYWFGATPEERGAKQKLWFGGGPDVDAEIRGTFGDLVEQARAGKLEAWSATPRGALAWLILVDQFSRNIYRNQPESFSADHAALAWTRANLAKLETLSTIEQLFAYLPFEHAEDLDTQKVSVTRFTRLGLRDDGDLEMMKLAVDSARKHLEVIARFGRFPHRNEILGRTSTAEETEYLAFARKAKQWL